MGSRSAVAACAAIAVLAAMVAPVGAAHAQGDGAGFKDGLKFGVSQAVDPSGKANDEFDRAESQICDHDPHSPGCTTVTVTANGVKVILAVSGVSATLLLVSKLVRHLSL